jgi:hypothetical protein
MTEEADLSLALLKKFFEKSHLIKKLLGETHKQYGSPYKDVSPSGNQLKSEHVLQHPYIWLNKLIFSYMRSSNITPSM